MSESQIRFDDGAAYEEFMGRWSILAGDVFLQWLAPAEGLRWADVGCGNGAFTERLLATCAPAEVQGIDPSEEQLAYARQRLVRPAVGFTRGDAQALPWPDASFDAAVMALVIFFVPDPKQGVAEMARIVRPGGQVSAYAWDILGDGFPFAALQQELEAMGIAPLWPPSTWASREPALRELWAGAGLVGIETREITVQRRFESFDAWWAIARSGPRLAPRVAAMGDDERERLQAGLRRRLAPAADGHIVCAGRANAVTGRRPV